MVRFLCCRGGGELSEDGKVFSQPPGKSDSAKAVGESITEAGEHLYTFTVRLSMENDGGAMAFGVTDASKDEWAADVPEDEGGPAWGFAAFAQKVFESDHCFAGPMRYHPPRISAALREGATGSSVKMRVDMTGRTLAFSANEEPFVEATDSLPAAVRPFVSLQKAGDAIVLAEYTAPVARVITLRLSQLVEDGSASVTCTTMGGDELAAFRAEPGLDVGWLRGRLAETLSIPFAMLKLVTAEARLLSDSEALASL